MPLHKINKIRNYGIFKKFDWDGALPTFSSHNLIYGWNYSGKTTLSRIFRSYETGRKHPDYLSATFEIELKDGRKLSESDLDKGTYFRVFNSDFVGENLKWESSIEPIFLLGQENIELQTKLEEERKKLEDKNKEVEKYDREKTDSENRLEKALTDKARDVKNLLSIPDYTKRHFQPSVEKVLPNPASHVLPDTDLQKNITTYKSTDKKDKVSSVNLTVSNLTELSCKVRDVLSTTVNSKIIEKLKSDPTLNDWVKTGMGLHEGKATCEFCGGVIPSDLFEVLGNHFTDDYAQLITDTGRLAVTVSASKLTIILPDEAKLFSEFKSGFISAKDQLNAEVTAFNAVIQQFADALDAKKSAAFDVISLSEYQDNSETITKALESLNAILASHNTKSDSFEKEQKYALEKIISHFVSQFITDEKYSETKKAIGVIDEAVKALKLEITVIKGEIRQIEQQLSETVKGAEKINGYLMQYFGKGDLAIKVTPESKFRLYRNEVLAKNLSEGEKTAIAFAYFITRLEDKNTSLANTVVYVDDPISSLDSNHLFNTYSFIKNKLHNCKQLFLSTHNYEFFNLIKEWFKHLKKEDKSFYLVERTTNKAVDESCIKQIPNYIIIYKSEYVYLFSIIHQFHTNPTLDYYQLYNLPNLIRRYVEAFMSFKIPSTTGIDKRIELLIPDKVKSERVMRFVHHYSHSSSIIRSLEFPDLSECSDIVRTVIEAVETIDKVHFDHLIGAITNPIGG